MAKLYAKSQPKPQMTAFCLTDNTSFLFVITSIPQITLFTFISAVTTCLCINLMIVKPLDLLQS